MAIVIDVFKCCWSTLSTNWPWESCVLNTSCSFHISYLFPLTDIPWILPPRTLLKLRLINHEPTSNLFALFVPYSPFAYIQSHPLTFNTLVLQYSFLSPLIIPTCGFASFLIQTRHTNASLSPLSAVCVCPIPQTGSTKLSAISYFYLSLNCLLLPLYIQGLQTHCSLVSSVSFKKISLLWALFPSPLGPEFHYSLPGTFLNSSVSLFHRKN